jgi:DMSO reductase anchor subunit
MTKTDVAPAARTWHEWPLVVFSALGIMGAGLLTAPLPAWLAVGTPAPAAGVLPWGVLLLGAGLVVSLAHLGRPRRAPLAALGVGRSRLSAEIALAGLTLAVGGVTSVLAYVSPALDIVTATSAVAFLAALGLVYSLPAQPAWRGAVVWTPLSSALGFGTVSLAGLWGGALVAVGPVAAVVLAADTGLLLLRRAALTYGGRSLAPRHPHLFARRDLVLGARFLLVDVLPGACLFAGLPKGAAAVLALGILVDRIAFYGLACQLTTEAEVARVEALLAG